MNFGEEQITRHAENVVRKKERIETLEALLATHEAMGAEPDSRHIRELKQRIRAATDAAHGHALKKEYSASLTHGGNRTIFATKLTVLCRFE